MKTFESGATRDDENDKLDYEGFLSPLVLSRYAEYMNKHRIQADGEARESDNWQKGIPFSSYMKSWWRHLIEAWSLWRAAGAEDVEAGLKCWSPIELRDISEALCAALFNNMGMLHEIEKEIGS